MKVYLALIAVFVACSVYIFYNTDLLEDDDDQGGDAPLFEEEPLILGKEVEEPVNDTLKIAEIQTSYVKYTKGLVDFDDLIGENIENLETVLNFPFAPKKGYLFSVGYGDNSEYQFYYQSDQEETRTVIFKVVAGEEKNKVTKIYDGEYMKLVSVNEDNLEELLLYDSENNESSLAVN